MGTSNNSFCHCGLDPQSLNFQPIAAFAAMTVGIFRSAINVGYQQKPKTENRKLKTENRKLFCNFANNFL